MRRQTLVVFGLLILIGLSACKSRQRQVSGFVILDKAEKSRERGDYKKALRLLDKAEKANYGFCGNAYFAAYATINLERSHILIEQNRYKEAREYMAENTGFYGNLKFDTLWVTALVREFGINEVRDAVLKADSAQTYYKDEDDIFANRVKIELPALKTYMLVGNSSLLTRCNCSDYAEDNLFRPKISNSAKYLSAYKEYFLGFDLDKLAAR